MGRGDDHVVTGTVHPATEESGIPPSELLFNMGHTLHRFMVERDRAAVPDSDHHVRVFVAVIVHLRTLFTHEQDSQQMRADRRQATASESKESRSDAHRRRLPVRLIVSARPPAQHRRVSSPRQRSFGCSRDRTAFSTFDLLNRDVDMNWIYVRKLLPRVFSYSSCCLNPILYNFMCGTFI
ncbi:hypothetical protein ANCCEY_12892 [Ancylostoma ceylanicum]|uniref:Uncharacterized protein n=1 Tax=Ancylostoma ceylanicum TaxID=53326 RepID=A0A0D6L885_9BILA|nr:hypothetical protein ANCCEY_12892 [Ancylostoma ceylanicum]